MWKSNFVVLELVVGSGGQDKIDKMFKEWTEGISGNCSHKKTRIQLFKDFGPTVIG